MGCGKSKLDAVANASILTRKKSSVNGAQEAVKEETTIPANGINKEEESKSVKQREMVEGGKVIEEKELAVVEGEGLVSKESPDKYFLSRHQREGSVDNKSEYSSPRVDSKESPFDDHREVNHVDVNGDNNSNGAVGDDHPIDGTINTEATAPVTTTETIVVEEKEEKPSTMDEPSAANQV